MKNRNGFTLVELLITITILGIIIAIAIPVLTRLSQTDIETQERIYEDVLITAAKLYNDSYSVDTFGRNKYGCKKIPYSKLKNKDLIKTLESNQLECAYKEKVGGEELDTSGLIVRKIEDNYYYETILWCKNKSTGKTIEEEGTDKKLYEIGDEYCNETANEDKNPPVVYYTNNNKRYFYNNTNKPIPKVWVYDDVSGLQVGKVKLDIEWKDLSNNRILNSRTNTYTISKPGRNLSPQTLALINEVKSGGNGQYQLTVRANTVVDGAGRMLKGNTLAVVEQPKVNPSRVTKLVTHPDIFYVENSAPTLSRTKDTQNWTKNPYTVTFTANDNDGKAVYSGIKNYTIKVVNNSTRRTIDNNITCGTATPETEIIKNNPKNSSQASRNCSIQFGTGNYKDGSYTVDTNVEDWAGNTNHSSNTYKYDGTKPTVTITRNSYNKYTWKATDNLSGLSGYKNDKVAADPTSGWAAINPTEKSKTGTYTIPNAGTHYTHVKDAAGNTAKASIAAYTVTRSQGAGTTLTTKFERSNGTAFTNNPAVLNETPIYITAKLNAGYEKLSIKYGGTVINSGTSKNTKSNVTISTSATLCKVGYWNNGSLVSCKKCPTGYTSDVGATAENKCYMNVAKNYYVKTKKASSSTACPSGYGSKAHKVYYGSKSSCTKKPTCTITLTPKANGNGWNKTDVTITLNTKNSPTSYGMDTSKKSTNGTKTVTLKNAGKYTYYGYVVNDGGSGSCSANINIDKTKPKCSMSGPTTGCGNLSAGSFRYKKVSYSLEDQGKVQSGIDNNESEKKFDAHYNSDCDYQSHRWGNLSSSTRFYCGEFSRYVYTYVKPVDKAGNVGDTCSKSFYTNQGGRC